MTSRLPPLLAILLLTPAGCATSGTEVEAAAAEPTLSPRQVVAARQAAFNLSAPAFGGMRSAVESGGEVKPLAFAARGLARWAQVLPTMFPEGTQLPESRALPAVWTDRAGFDAKATAFQAATANLAAAAQSGDKAAFAAAYKAVGESCGSCHDSYRAEAAR